jgi:hypothetical protein
MSSCFFVDSDELLSRCPRLRTLRLQDVSFHMGVLSVNSPLLEELVVAAAWIDHVNIVAPVLTQLTLSLDTCYDFNISILAPLVEKVSWDCYISKQFSMFGLWRLEQLSLHRGQGQPSSLQIHACIVCPVSY